MRVLLPWPDKSLSPNARLHWATKARATKKARQDAAYAVYETAGGGMREVRAAFAGTDPIPMQVQFYPPDKRHRDDDNMVGAFKFARDGLAEALGVDDRRFRAHYIFEQPEKPGRIVVTFGSGDNPWINFPPEQQKVVIERDRHSTEAVT